MFKTNETRFLKSRVLRARWGVGLVLAYSCISPMVVSAQADFSELVVFGDSLSDTGNIAAVLVDRLEREAIIGNQFIPLAPYASGRFTNDQTWVDLFGATHDVPAEASLSGGTNYSFGASLINETPEGYPPSLADQALNHFAVTEGVLGQDALYVIAGGGNDARIAMGEIALGADLAATIASAATTITAGIGAIVDDLQLAGAKNIVVWNLPNLSQVPAISAQGELAATVALNLTQATNAAIQQEVLDQNVLLFDLYSLTTEVAAEPSAFGLINASDACGAIAECDPATYLFWDGIHPTSAGHELIATRMTQLVSVPEPNCRVLVLTAGWAVIASVRRRRLQR